jgi:hypothetical protein
MWFASIVRVSARAGARLAIMVTIATFLLGGCGPYIEPYRYIHLADVPGLEQVEKRQPALSGLHLAGPMPVRYRLSRADYELDIAVPGTSYLPAVELRVITPGLTLVPTSAEVPPSPVFCGAWYPHPDEPDRLAFGWSPRCADDQPREIAFDVEGSGGGTVGEERLSFRLERNGWLVLVDAV